LVKESAGVRAHRLSVLFLETLSLSVPRFGAVSADDLAPITAFATLASFAVATFATLATFAVALLANLGEVAGLAVVAVAAWVVAAFAAATPVAAQLRGLA